MNIIDNIQQPSLLAIICIDKQIRWFVLYPSLCRPPARQQARHPPPDWYPTAGGQRPPQYPTAPTVPPDWHPTPPAGEGEGKGILGARAFRRILLQALSVRN